MSNIDFVYRLKIFIKSKGLGQTKFEELVGFSRGFISKVTPSIGVDKLLDIIYFFPDLNIEWLITGKGKMTNPSINSDNSDKSILKVDEDTLLYKNKYIELLEENRALRIEIEKLRDINKKK